MNRNQSIWGYMREVGKKRHLLLALAQTQLQEDVIRSPLKYLWWILDPLLNLLCYVFLVTALGRGNVQNGIPYPLFVLIAIMPWSWMNMCLMSSMKIFNRYSAVITQIRIPNLIFLISSIVKESFLYVISFFVLGTVAVLAYGLSPHPAWLAIPAVMLLHGVMIFSLMLILSVLAVYFYDTIQLIPYLLRIWFFMSPALYSVDILPVPFKKYIYFNPMTNLFEEYRNTFLHGLWPEWPVYFLWFGFWSAVLWMALNLFITREKYFTRLV